MSTVRFDLVSKDLLLLKVMSVQTASVGDTEEGLLMPDQRPSHNRLQREAPMTWNFVQ